MRAFILLFISFILPISASAQFYVTGDDPGKLKWNFIDTESYRIIYPQGKDSLARIYGYKLEKFKIPVSRTSGYITGQGDGRLMPVVLHAHNGSNGSVSWAPKRMDMFTIPSAYDPEPMPWSTMLAVHESRHVTQMQFGLLSRMRPGNWFMGQAWNILTFVLYPGISKMEGDAVIVETAYTPSGRGRTADFLNYFWVAFDNGDFRDWFKWRYDFQRPYTPSYYALGYLTIGGYRYLYDYPYLVSDALHGVSDHPGRLGCLFTTMKKKTGKKWNESFREVCDTMYGIWKKDAQKRAPYIISEQVTPHTGKYTDYTDLMSAGSDLYAVKKGHVNAPILVRIDSTGNEHRVSSYPSVASSPKYDIKSGKIYWSETIPHERWSLAEHSKIRYIDNRNNLKHTLHNKSLLYNPCFTDDSIISVEYHTSGYSSLSILDKMSGKTEDSYAAPDSLQLVESTSLNGKIYVTGISENGYGIYALDRDSGKWSVVLAPQPVMIKDFNCHNDELIFTSDRTGVNELYHLDPISGKMRQKTSTRYGSFDFQYSEDGYLYYSSQTLNGKHIFRTPVDSLLDRSVDFAELYRYPIAEKLTAQEKQAAIDLGNAGAENKEVTFSKPERYRKFPHIFNLHSWFPIYASVDNIMNMSFDNVWQAASLGVSGIIQNHLSTAVGEFGYSAHPDPYNSSKWRHSGHVKLTYSGLYPVFQFSFDINDRGARQYTNYTDAATEKMFMVDSRELSMPYIQGKINAYIPFNFSSGGWSKGLIPKISYTISNDIFNTGTTFIDRGLTGEFSSFAGHKEGKKRIRQQLSGSLRTYTMRSIANSQVYPRVGIGAEAGVSGSVESYNVFSPMGYAYVYGYIPGFDRTHGIRLSAMWQTKLRNDSPFSQQIVNVLPRGLSDNSVLGSHLSLYNKNIVKLTADYAIPIHTGFITLGGNMLTVKRLVVYPNFDYTFIGNKGLWSAGLDLTADLQAIITIEWPCSIGVSFAWNGGSAWNQLSKNIEMNKWFVGPVFNVTF